MASRAPWPRVQEHETDRRLDTADDSYAWLLAGPLGCGKSLAAKHLQYALDSRGEFTGVVEFSDYVRYLYEQEGPGGEGSDDDNQLGVWAAEVRKDKGIDYFAERLASEVGGPQPQARHVIITGVRSPTTPPVFDEHFDVVNTIVLWAFPELRFRRVHEERGTDRETFEERNEREMEEWDCREFFIDPANYDYVVPNNYDDEELLAMAITRIGLDVYNGDRDASIYEHAPWHATREQRTRLAEVHPL